MFLVWIGLVAQSDFGGDHIDISEIFGGEDETELEGMMIAGLEGMMIGLDGMMIGLDAPSNRAVAGPSPLSMSVLAAVGSSLFGDWRVTIILLAFAAVGAVDS